MIRINQTLFALPPEKLHVQEWCQIRRELVVLVGTGQRSVQGLGNDRTR